MSMSRMTPFWGDRSTLMSALIVIAVRWFSVVLLLVMTAEEIHGAGPFGLFPNSMLASAPCDDVGCDGVAANGRYLSFSSGWNFLHDYQGEQAPVPQTVVGKFNDGWSIRGTIGQRLTQRIRGELDFSFRDNTPDQWIINGTPGPASGHVNVYATSVNLLYDFDFGCAVRPYIGAGFGGAHFRGDIGTPGPQITVDDTTYAFQMIAGASTSIASNAELFAEYRNAQFGEVDIVNRANGAVLAKEEFETENVVVGIRFYR